MERLKRTLLLLAAALTLLVAVPVYAQESTCGCGNKEGECTKPEGEKCAKCKAQAVEQSEARGWLGVELRPVADATRAQLDLPEGRGLEIARVVPDSPASQAKLKAGDIIVSIADEEIAGVDDLRRVMSGKKAGQVVVFGLIRKRKEIEVSVKLGKQPAQSGLTLKAVPDAEGKAPRFEKPPVNQRKPTARTAEQIRDQAKNFLDQMRERRAGKKGQTAESVAEFMDQMFAEKSDEPEDEGENEEEAEDEEDDDDEDEAEEQSPFGGDLGDMLRGLLGGQEGEEGKSGQPDFGKLLQGAQEWMQSEEGQRMMETVGKMFGGKQEGEDEDEGEEESPEMGFDPAKIRQLIDQFLGGREGGEEGGIPQTEKLRKMFGGVFGPGEGEDAEDETEGEGEEDEVVQPRPQQQPAFGRFREVVRAFENRLGKLEREHQEIMKMYEALEPELGRLAERATKEVEKMVTGMKDKQQKQIVELIENRLQDFAGDEETAGAFKGQLEKMGRQVREQLTTLKKELDRQRAINERLNSRVKELEDIIREFMQGGEFEPTLEKPEAEYWRDFEPEAGKGGIMIVKPEGEAGGVMVLEPAKPKFAKKPTKPAEPEKPAIPEDRPWLGIVPADPDEATREELGLPEKGGCLIEEIVPDSPAEKAGLQADDFVVAFKGKKVKSSEHLRDLIAGQNIGAKVKIDFIREGERVSKTVKLGTVPRFSALPLAPVMNASLISLPSFSDFPFPDDRKPRGRDDGGKKKDKRKKSEKKNVVKPGPQEEMNLLGEIEDGLQMLRSLGVGRKLYIAIQDERGNNLFRHEFKPENLIKAVQTHIIPLLDSVRGRMGGREEQGFFPMFEGDFDEPEVVFFGDEPEMPCGREGMGGKDSCPLGIVRAHAKKFMHGHGAAQEGGPRLKLEIGMQGQPCDETWRGGKCPCQCRKKRGMQQKGPQQRRSVRRVESRVFAFGDEEGLPGEAHIEFLGEGDGDMMFEGPQEFPGPGDSRIRVKVLKVGPYGEPCECCPGERMKVFNKAVQPGRRGVTTRTFKFGGEEGFPGEARVEVFVEPEEDIFIEGPEGMPFPGNPKMRVKMLKSRPDGQPCECYPGEREMMFEGPQGGEPDKSCCPGVKIIKKLVAPFFEDGGEQPKFEFRIEPDREERSRPERPKAPKKARRHYESI